MAKLIYVHDGESVYDKLFLESLARDNIVYFLSFNHDPQFIPKKIRAITMNEPFSMLGADLDFLEGLRMYLLSLLRSFLLRQHLRRLNPQALLGCMATKYGFYSALSGFRPFILIVWGSDVLVAPKRFLIFRFMAKYALKKADAIILDSRVQRDAVVSLGCNPEKILKFPWFDLEQVRVKHPRNEVRRKLGWADNPIVLSSRRHDPICGVQHVIEAIPHVIQAYPETRFLILGYGKLTTRFKARVKEMGMQDYVKFLGNVPRDDVTTYVNASDVYVSGSLSDGTSASLLEAMTLKVPSVVTNIPGNEEWIENGVNGYLVPVKDPEQLVEKIILLLKDARLRKQISERAFETVRVKVNWKKSSAALDTLISELVREK